MFHTNYFCEYELPDELNAIQQHVRRYDVSVLESFSILKLQGKIGFYGTCDSPHSDTADTRMPISGYRIRCGVNKNLEYPIRASSDMVSTDLDTINSSQPSVSEIASELSTLSELVIWLSGLTFYEYIRLIGAADVQQIQKEDLSRQWLDSWRQNGLDAN